MVAYADLVLPDTTYLERWDCISLLDRPICSADGPADAIRQPVVQPDRDVRPFQDVLIDLGARLGLPGHRHEDGKPKYPGGYPDYIVNHERKPGHRPAGRLARQGRRRERTAIGRRTPDSSSATSRTVLLARARAASRNQRYFKHANKDYTGLRRGDGLHPPRLAPVVLQLYSEVLQKFRLAAQGPRARSSRRTRIARGSRPISIPLPFWYPPFEGVAGREEFPCTRITQRPMAMYHSWGSQNAWLRQIMAENRLYIQPRAGPTDPRPWA